MAQRVKITGYCENCGEKVEVRRSTYPEDFNDCLKKHHPNNGCLYPNFSHAQSEDITD